MSLCDICEARGRSTPATTQRGVSLNLCEPCAVAWDQTDGGAKDSPDVVKRQNRARATEEMFKACNALRSAARFATAAGYNRVAARLGERATEIDEIAGFPSRWRVE